MINFFTDIKSPNFNTRPENCHPQFIILHYTDMLFNDAVDRLCDPDAGVSAHYIIKKSGEIYNLVADEYRAWHAGISYWNSIENLNDHSIGIEIDNLGNEDFTKAQMSSCIQLCHLLMKKYNIQGQNVLGHSDIAADRKLDPGIFFNWKLLEANGIGIRFDHPDVKVLLEREKNNNSISFIQSHLKSIGYRLEVTDIYDPQTNYVMRAFLSHFQPKALWKRGGVEYYQDSKVLF